ncbi:MAG: sulfurtransferase [Chloroflexi bacterium]|nr:sulfurtransferase [Chloroflexota bacterium]
MGFEPPIRWTGDGRGTFPPPASRGVLDSTNSIDGCDTPRPLACITRVPGYHARVLNLPGPLVSVDWLARHRDDAGLRIADVRWSLADPAGRERYDAGHIPGAVFLDADRGLSSPGEGPGRHPIPSSDKLARVLGDAGIGDEHVVVAYDDAGGSSAARLWWLYRHFGHDGACAVLDGGIDAWTGAGLALETDAPEYPAATWTPRTPREDTLDADAVAALLATDAVVLDARAGERYRGETEPIDARPGHIPGALSAPWTDNLGSDGRFLPPLALRERYAKLGADERTTVAYCGSGLTATHDLLAMELAGLPPGRLYEGSWSDWSSQPARPAATGEQL